MKTGTLGPDDFVVKPPVADGVLTVNAIDFGLVRSPKDLAEAFMESVLTTLTRAEVRAEGGLLKLDDLAVVLVFDRHRGVKRRSFGFARNLMKRGAIASSVAHDGHNLVVMGKDQKDMQAAAELVTRGKGGIAAVDSKSLAFVDLPVAGLMSEEGLGEVSKKMRGLRSAFKKMGVIDHPYMPVVALLTLSVIPHARITDKGVYDVDGRRFVEPFVPGENP
jgi:adenine deaminase